MQILSLRLVYTCNHSAALLVRFSSSDGCERVDELLMRAHILRTFITHLLIHMHQKKKIALEIATKLASVNEPCELCIQINDSSCNYKIGVQTINYVHGHSVYNVIRDLYGRNGDFYNLYFQQKHNYISNKHCQYFCFSVGCFGNYKGKYQFQHVA